MHGIANTKGNILTDVVITYSNWCSYFPELTILILLYTYTGIKQINGDRWPSWPVLDSEFIDEQGEELEWSRG